MNRTTSARLVSPWYNILSIMLFIILATLWSGCAMTTTLDGKLFQGIGTDGTLVLGEVTYILSREQIEKGVINGPHKIPPIYQELLSNGYSDQEMIEGKVVVIVYQTYWHNRSRSHDFLDWAVVENGIKVNKGNVVDLQFRKPYAIVTGVLFNDIKGSGCQLIEGDRGGLSALDLGKV